MLKHNQLPIQAWSRNEFTSIVYTEKGCLWQQFFFFFWNFPTTCVSGKGKCLLGQSERKAIK